MKVFREHLRNIFRSYIFSIKKIFLLLGVSSLFLTFLPSFLPFYSPQNDLSDQFVYKNAPNLDNREDPN